MNTLAWDTYRQDATAFVHEWAAERDEKGEAQLYWDAFFRIFAFLNHFCASIRTHNGR